MPVFKFRSLRGRLTLFCFVTVMIVIFILLAPHRYNEDIKTITLDNGTEQTTRTVSPLAPWVFPILFGATFPTAFLAWVWAGRVVRPIVEITQTASDIQSGSLDRRIHLPHGLSEIQGLAQQFNRMMDRLADESRIQTQLLEDTGHEIRTPLAVLANNAEVMLADPSPTQDSYRTSTELTAKTVSRLRDTVEELLAGATFASLKIRQTDNDLSIVAQRVSDQCAEAAQAANVTIITKLPTQLLCAFDGRSVERALSNLLNNAIRFSPPDGFVTITVGSEDDRSFASVEDLGPGIDANQMGRVFERYVSSSQPMSPHQGIGLAIVKQVADAHRGITVDSPINGNIGTRFTMWFQR